MNPRLGFLLLATLSAAFTVSMVESLSSPVQARAQFTGPEQLQIGVNFVAQCSVALEPSSLAHNVTFYLNNQPLGQYVVGVDGQRSWQTLLLIPGVNVFQGPEPAYSVLVEPGTIAARGVYKCAVTVEVPGGGGRGQARYFSNEWDGLNVSGKRFAPPTVTVAYRNLPEVKAITVGEPFVGKCSLDMSLVDANYKVKFVVDRWVRAQYVVTAKQPTPSVHWQLLQPYAHNMNVFRGNDTSYPDFSVQFVPVGAATPAQGVNTRFRCDVELELPNGGGSAQFYSNPVCTVFPEQQCNNLV